MSKKAIITIGVSASGKSTWASGQVNEHTYNIERDEIRLSILQQKNLYVKNMNIWEKWNFKWENEVTRRFDADIEWAFGNNQNIVISDTNLNIDRRNQLADKLKNLGYDIEYKVFGQDLTLDELWKRDRYRLNTVGHSTVAKQYAKFRKEFPKYQLKDTTDKPKAFIVDIDGSITIGPHNRSPYEWNKVGQDLPNELSIILVNGLFASSNYDIVFLSGRDEVCRTLTEEWLEFNTKIPKEYIKSHLFMRKQNDMRKDTIIKEELFFEHIDGKYNVKYCLEDRPVVYRQYLELGITPFFVGNTYLEF